MTVIRSLFDKSFQAWPSWECPTCSRGHLNLLKETLKSQETGPSKKLQDENAWEPDWITKRFVALLQCNFALCEEVVAISGTTHLVEDAEEDPGSGRWHQVFIDSFEPRFLSPAPVPIRIVKATPEEVESCLREAAGLLWQSPEAAANQMRQAVEHLMDALKVKKKGAKGGQLTLHARIEAFEKNDQTNGALLKAVKWLGNSGSHAGGLDRDDVLDAFDMIEHVLSNVYDTSAKQILKKARAINKAKGPAKKKK